MVPLGKDSLLRGDIIQLGEAVLERFPFCGTLPCSANFGALEMENIAFCEILAGKEKHPEQKRD